MMEAQGTSETSGGCPRCGSTPGTSYWREGVCLRCAGQNLLLSDLVADSTPAAPSVGEPGRSVDPADELRGEAAGALPRLGSYEILDELGRGGMGRVYAARQVGLGRIVAVKVMAEAHRGMDLELRFLREAQTAARLRHPGIVAVHDFGRADGRAYFSMELVEGGDLSRRNRERPFVPQEAATMMLKIAEALAYAHREGVLHRDLKPSNILLDGGEPKIADFGLAAQLEAGGDLTAQTGILGTPHYLAPEALKSGSAALSVASDLYALGVILFELLTGRTPYAGAAPAVLAGLVATTEPPSPRLLAPAVPVDLETICVKCLEREPGRRYRDAESLADDLRRFLGGEPIRARPLSATEHLWRWCRRRPALATVWALLTALAVGSTASVVLIQGALGRATKAEAISRDRLREARLAEARAVRRTPQVGRREQALAALAEAARIRPGLDLRNEAVSTMIIPDLVESSRWQVPDPRVGVVETDLTGTWLAFHPVTPFGDRVHECNLYRWGATNVTVRLDLPPTNVVGLLHFSMDGRLGALRFLDEKVRCWRIGDSRPFQVLPAGSHPGGGMRTDAFNDDVAFGPDGTWLAVGVPGPGVVVYQLANGKEDARWEGSGPRFNRIRCSPDGERIAAFAISSLETRDVWLLRRRQGKLELERRFNLSSAPNSVAWSGDGRLLAVTTSDNGIVVYDPASGHLITHSTTTTREPNEASFVGSDTLITFRGNGSSARFFDFVLGREEFVLDGIGPGRVGSRVGSDAVLSSTLFGEQIQWTLRRPTGYRALMPPGAGGYEGSFNAACIDFSPDGRRMLVAHARSLVLQEATTGFPLARLDSGNTKGMDSATAAFVDDGRSVIRCSIHTGVVRWKLRESKDGRYEFAEPTVLDPETGWVLSDRLPGARRLAFVDPRAGRVRIAELESDRFRVHAIWDVPGVYSVAFHPSGDQIFVHGVELEKPDPASPRLQVRRVSDGTIVATPAAPASGEVIWSADGSVVLTSNGTIESYLWDPATWKPRAKLTGSLGGNSTTFGLSPDGRYAVVLSDQKVQLLSTRDGTLMVAFDAPEAVGMAAAVRFLPDRSRFAVLWRDGRVDIVDPTQWTDGLSRLGMDWQ